jgi:hypothetical protein
MTFVCKRDSDADGGVTVGLTEQCQLALRAIIG